MVRFEVPDGWTVQAFRFTLDPTEEQARSLARHFGARRKVYNWTVASLKADIEAWHTSGAETAKPSLPALRKRWNTVKDEVCVNAETGAVWWPSARRRPTPMESAVRWMPIGTGRPPVLANAPENASGSRGSNARAATLTGCVLPPGRCVSSPTAGI
jgi:hypothetical protein